MKVVYTRDALRDLEKILTFIDANYPAVAPAFVARLRMIERRIGRWPESAAKVEQRPEVRMASFIRYPYKLFYRIGQDAVEVLHVHHVAQQDR